MKTSSLFRHTAATFAILAGAATSANALPVADVPDTSSEACSAQNSEMDAREGFMTDIAQACLKSPEALAAFRMQGYGFEEAQASETVVSSGDKTFGQSRRNFEMDTPYGNLVVPDGTGALADAIKAIIAEHPDTERTLVVARIHNVAEDAAKNEAQTGPEMK
jgi:hypothetical protein